MRGSGRSAPAGEAGGHLWSAVNDASLAELTRAATTAARASELADR
jgi:hypothetical protein